MFGKKRHPETKGGMTRRPGRSKSFLSSGEDVETALLCFCVFDYFWVRDYFHRKRLRSKLRYRKREKFPLARRSLTKGGGGGTCEGEEQGSSAQCAKRHSRKKLWSPTLVEEEEACSVGRGHVLRHVADLQVVDKPSEEEQEACGGRKEWSVYSRGGGYSGW